MTVVGGGGFALRDARYKMVLDVAADRFTMYDLSGDPREEHDVFERAQGERAGWRETLRIAARTRSTLAELDPATRRKIQQVED